MTPEETQARLDDLITEHPELKILPLGVLVYLLADGDEWVLNINAGEGP